MNSARLDPAAEEPLTPLGRKLARLPIDPRLGRMVLEADALGCAREVAVIAAALSIQDPRERPVEHRGQADQLHARFADKASDFLAYVNLWRYLRSLEGEMSRSQIRKRCKAEFLHYLRIREWQDLVAQLEDAAREVGLTLNETPADGGPRSTTALLSGLLSHLGMPRTPQPARVHRRARSEVRDLPRLRARPPWTELGDGRRARGDHAAVGSHRRGGRYPPGRGPRRPPRQTLLRGPALGRVAAPPSSPPSRSPSTGWRSSSPAPSVRAHRPGGIA